MAKQQQWIYNYKLQFSSLFTNSSMIIVSDLPGYIVIYQDIFNTL